jgi:hypothetical protein
MLKLFPYVPRFQPERIADGHEREKAAKIIAENQSSFTAFLLNGFRNHYGATGDSIGSILPGFARNELGDVVLL